MSSLRVHGAMYAPIVLAEPLPPHTPSADQNARSRTYKVMQSDGSATPGDAKSVETHSVVGVKKPSILDGQTDGHGHGHVSKALGHNTNSNLINNSNIHNSNNNVNNNNNNNGYVLNQFVPGAVTDTKRFSQNPLDPVQGDNATSESELVPKPKEHGRAQRGKEDDVDVARDLQRKWRSKWDENISPGQCRLAGCLYVHVTGKPARFAVP